MADEKLLGDARTDAMGRFELTIAEAAERLDVSAKTVRRRLRAGELAGEKVLDPALGVERWLIDPASLPQTSTSAAVIPVELLDRLTDAYKDAAEANARAEVAERVADFEKERRETAETEAATEKKARSTAEFVSKLEKEGREAAEVDRDETLAELAEIRAQYEGLRDKKWWQRKP